MPRRPRIRPQCGAALWHALPRDMHEQVLSISSFTLSDLAKMGQTCKFFQGVFRQRCAEEERWLKASATSAFGERLTTLLLAWLATPPPSRAMNRLHLEDGEWPQPDQIAALDTVRLQVPAWGRGGPPGGATVRWILYSGRRWRGIGLQTDEPTPMWFSCECVLRRSMAIDIIHPNSDPSQLVPLLALVGLALKHVAAATGEAPLGARPGSRLPNPRGNSSDPRSFRVGGLRSRVVKLRWECMDWVRDRDVQRALHIVKMLAIRSEHSLPKFDLLW
jgi:hypothetical protein